MTADRQAVSLDDDESAIEAMEHRDRRCRAVGHVEAQLRRIREGYNAADDSIAIRHVLRAEDDPPVPRPVRQFAEQIVDYSIGSPFAPADPTDALPPSLRSVDDVRRVCEAVGLPEVTSESALAAWKHNAKSRLPVPITRTWQDRDLRVTAVSAAGRLRVTVESFSGADWLGEGRTLTSAVFAAAIRSAREETP